MTDDIDRLADDGCPHAAPELDADDGGEGPRIVWTDCDYED